MIAAENAGLEIHEHLTWVKNHFVLGRQDYQWKHEPCLYGWKEGGPHYFINSRSETTVIPDLHEIEPERMKKDELVDLIKKIMENTATTVIYENKPLKSLLHPTMKPVNLIGYQMRNSSRKGENVLDLFGGSGTTLIVAEQIKRNCFMMEYEPKYADVIIQRWEEMTGKKAVLLKKLKEE
jgi:DNA modification methylase